MRSALSPRPAWNVGCTRAPSRERDTGSSERMSVDCEECLSSAPGANSTEPHQRSAADEDDELLRYIWRDYLQPKRYEWVLIAGYILVFLVSLVGNSLGECQ